MSLRAYLRAVRDAIKAEYQLGEHDCDVTPDGQPHPAAGQFFYAVHPGGMQQSPLQNHWDERADLLVTITQRTGVPPQDRLGENVVLDDDGLLARAERCRVLVGALNYTIMGVANGFITSAANGFVEPLRYLSLTWLGPKGPNWFFAEAEGQDDACTGLAVQIAFGKARRVQDVLSAS